MNNGAKRFLSGIAYSLGVSRPIDVLQESEGVSAETVGELKTRGLKEFCEEGRTIPEMCMASALETLDRMSLSPGEIDVIVLATSNAGWVNTLDDETTLFRTFVSAGFTKTRLIGLSLQACSAFGETVRIASDLVNEKTGALNVLVIIFGRKETVSRLGPAASTIYSDGAASCLVSATPGEFEICASESLFNIRLGSLGRGGNFEQFREGVRDLTEICRRVYANSGLGPERIRRVFSTNGSLVHLVVASEAAGVPLSHVFDEDVARFAHVFSCDNLISLKNYSAKTTPVQGEHFLLVGWSPHVVSAAILRCA